MRRSVALALLICVATMVACAPNDDLVGTWKQTGIMSADGTVRPVSPAESASLALRRGGSATMRSSDAATTSALTWDIGVNDTLALKGHPGWAVREVYELEYALEGERLTIQWIDSGPERVFERQ